MGENGSGEEGMPEPGREVQEGVWCIANLLEPPRRCFLFWFDFKRFITTVVIILFERQIH